jgi:diguanylate cyclase (GGDEF)-like protein
VASHGTGTALADDPAAFAALVLRIAAHVADLPDASRDAGVATALGELGSAVGADRAYTFVVDERSATLRNDHEWCAPGIAPQRDQLQAVPLEVVGGWWPRFEADTPVVIPSVAALDPTTHPEAAILAGHGVRSLLAVPMRRHGRTFGFVGFDAVSGERSWSDPEVHAIEMAAHLIGGTLERAAAATERDEADRRLAQLANQLPGALFQFELLPDGARRFAYTSPRFGELLGIDTRTLADDGRPALDRVLGEDRAAFEDALRRSARGLERWDHVFRARDARGRLRVIHGRAEPSRRADGAIVFHGVLNDVSERLAQQQALERGAAFRRSLLTLTHDLLARDVADDLYRSVLALGVAHVPGADAGSVIVRGADDRFRFEAADGFDLDALRSIAFEPGDMQRRQPPRVEVLEGGGEHHLLPADTRAALEAAGRLHEIRATLSVPVVVHGDTVAYLQLDSFDRHDAFDDDAIASGTLLAGLLGALLQRLSLESKLRQERSKLDHMAHHDHLTGLPNRVLLSDRLEQALARDRRAALGTALLVVDLDGFKTVNDTFGHAAGDQLLTAIGARLREALRDEDTVARLGGDEFAVVASGLADPTSASRVARQVAAVVSAAYVVAGREVHVGGSIGVAVAPQDGTDAGTLLKNADLAMYRVKSEGRGAIAFFTADLDARLRARAALTEDLRAALQASGLQLVFQPRVRLSDGFPVGVEALARWNHPRRGPVPPAEFVPLAEEAGLALPLGAHVLDLACGALADWRRGGRAADWRMAVNVSPHQLRAGGFDELVRETLARHRLPASALDLEVTESAMLDERPQVLEPLQRLRRAGVRVAMDDFGTGYSSLHRLAVLPVDTLKIDRSFVAGLGRLERDAAVVDAILALAHGLGLEVVAEGVETDGQRRALLERGCLLAQGFLFTEPLPADRLWRWMGRRDDGESVKPSDRARHAARRPAG